MLKALLDFLLNRKGNPTQLEVEIQAASAPYKTEAPAKCGCGRSPTGLCVGLHKLSETEWATHADNPNKPAAKPAAKKPAPKKQQFDKKPAAMKVPAEAKPKAPAKPRAPKAPK